MADGRKPYAQAATQYLKWALEEIEKAGHLDAALHVQIALNALSSPASADLGAANRSGTGTVPRAVQDAKRFRDKADEAEQLAELAETASRREALMSIAESYRLTAAQLDKASASRDAGTKSK